MRVHALRHSTVARSVLAAASASLLTAVSAGIGGGGTAAADQTPLPVGFATWVPCAAGGAGEMVVLSGTLHVTAQTVQRSADEWVTTSHVNPHGVVGIGEVTGDVYRGTGHTGATTVSTAAGQRITQTNSFRLIASGPGNDLLAQANLHLTVREDGSVVGEVDHVSLACR
jgi:hypothetical protein